MNNMHGAEKRVPLFLRTTTEFHKYVLLQKNTCVLLFIFALLKHKTTAEAKIVRTFFKFLIETKLKKSSTTDIHEKATLICILRGPYRNYRM